MCKEAQETVNLHIKEKSTTGSPATPVRAPRNSASTCWTKGDITAEFSLPLLEQLLKNIPKVHGWFTSRTPAPAQSSKVSGGRVEQFYLTWLRLHLVTTGYSPLWCAPESLTRESVCSAKPLKHVTSLKTTADGSRIHAVLTLTKPVCWRVCSCPVPQLLRCGKKLPKVRIHEAWTRRRW